MPRSVASTPARLWTPSAITFFVNGAVYGIWATQAPIAKARLGVSEADMGLLLLAGFFYLRRPGLPHEILALVGGFGVVLLLIGLLWPAPRPWQFSFSSFLSP